MFEESAIIEFINRLINCTDEKNEAIKINIMKFRDYLVLTKMVEAKTIIKIDNILSCLDSILQIRNLMGGFDITNLFNEQVKGKKLSKKPLIQPEYQEKHYSHYQSDSSTSCGGYSSNNCGTSSYRRC